MTFIFCCAKSSSLLSIHVLNFSICGCHCSAGAEYIHPLIKNHSQSVAGCGISISTTKALRHNFGRVCKRSSIYACQVALVSWTPYISVLSDDSILWLLFWYRWECCQVWWCFLNYWHVYLSVDIILRTAVISCRFGVIFYLHDIQTIHLWVNVSVISICFLTGLLIFLTNLLPCQKNSSFLWTWVGFCINSMGHWVNKDE